MDCVRSNEQCTVRDVVYEQTSKNTEPISSHEAESSAYIAMLDE
jgi:hypothetical protein